MPKFVPRQRKHKVLARSNKRQGPSHQIADTNLIEYVPAGKAEVEARKKELKEQLRNAGTKVSSKKAKRLEKYIENKLKKDQNRDLVERLANSKTDTSLYQSSKKLGQRRDTRKEKLGKFLGDQEAGSNIDIENHAKILDGLKEHNCEKGLFVDEEGADIAQGNTTRPLTEHIPHLSRSSGAASKVIVGVGLKRPLEVNNDGYSVLKKRKLRGGVKSKWSSTSQPITEPEWDGFESTSDADNEVHEASKISNGYKSDTSITDYDQGSNLDQSDESSESENGTSSSDGIEGHRDGEDPKNRSSAFKSWATAQLNEALGHHEASNVQLATDTPSIKGFQPRAKEEDPLPLELQPTTNIYRKAFSVAVHRTAEIQDARLKLPVVAEEQKIMEAVHNNNVIVVYGATGSGKTTQVPQFLFEAGYGSPSSPTPGMIGITQPRRVAAVSMAKRVGDELGDFGNRVAYQIRFEGTMKSDTAIKFMTDGVLLREVAQDIALRKYSAIIIDEAHERTVNTDILVGMLSRVVKLRQEMALEDASVTPLKLIIMSATLRIADFTENNILFAKPPPALQAEGRQYPVSVHFARRTYHDYLEEAFRKISKGHQKLPAGGFLVFLPGQNEILHLSNRLKDAFRISYTSTGPRVRISSKDAPLEAEDIDFGESVVRDGAESDDEVDIELEDDRDFELGEECDTGPTRMHILPLYSLLPTKEQLRVFEPPPDGSRLIVLATNVAETSLTIPGIRFVFDCGRSKERKYDRVTGVQSFEIGWISKASASQRTGRAGRTGPGHCYRLFSSGVYERDFEEYAEPEILRMPIEGVVLQLKAMNLQHVINFPFPTPPDRDALASSEKLLKYLSAVSPAGQITPSGSTMSVFPLSPRFARILLIGHLHNCLPYTIALVAGLSAAEVFIPENQVVPAPAANEETSFLTNAMRLEEDQRTSIRRQYNKVHHEFCFLDDKSDAIKLLQVVGEFAHEPTEAWCRDHYVRFKIMKEISQLRRQITDVIRTNIIAFAGLKYDDKLDPPSAKQVKALKQMVAAGFIDHIAIRADLTPNPTEIRRKPSRVIDVSYLTLFPSHSKHDDEDKAVYIHPSSPLAHLSIQECPDYIIYSYLQRAAPTVGSSTPPKTRMHALTDITGGQLAALTKGTPLLHYGKPIKGVMPKLRADGNDNVRECWVIPYLKAEDTGGIGWPLPARKVTQRKVAGHGWIVE